MSFYSRFLKTVVKVYHIQEWTLLNMEWIRSGLALIQESLHWDLLLEGKKRIRSDEDRHETRLVITEPADDDDGDNVLLLLGPQSVGKKERRTSRSIDRGKKEDPLMLIPPQIIMRHAYLHLYSTPKRGNGKRVRQREGGFAWLVGGSSPPHDSSEWQYFLLVSCPSFSPKLGLTFHGRN